MKTTIPVSPTGRITIPAAMRRQLDWETENGP